MSECKNPNKILRLGAFQSLFGIPAVFPIKDEEGRKRWQALIEIEGEEINEQRKDK